MMFAVRTKVKCAKVLKGDCICHLLKVVDRLLVPMVGTRTGLYCDLFSEITGRIYLLLSDCIYLLVLGEGQDAIALPCVFRDWSLTSGLRTAMGPP
jgi:hypothetical protein